MHTLPFFFFFRNVFSYEDMRSALLKLLDLLIEFMDSIDSQTYILAGGFNILTPKETLIDLLKDCAVVIAGNYCGHLQHYVTESQRFIELNYT